MRLPAFLPALWAAALASAGSLRRITADFPNPTNVTFYLYLPSPLPASPPILVTPHWCHGDALAVYRGSSFASLADEHGFLVIYPDSPNTGDKCWDVSSAGTLSHGSGGDGLGIANMVQWTLKNHAADAGRVFVTGVSSGAMMTNVLLGAYPDVFAAGTVFAGVPFGCFASPDGTTADYWNSECAEGRVRRTGDEWAGLVRAAYPAYRGWRPKVQVFHGTADEVLDYANFGEEVKQWAAVLGVDGTEAREVRADTPFPGWTKYVYGEEGWLEAYSALNVTHNIGNHEDVAVEWFGLKCKTGNCFRWGMGGPTGSSLKNSTAAL
ncbi:Alpha/beta-hydrolase [Coniochaeta hoffmannii]|uniref:Carboxylic ester hydrolase n=1 Tax=Coniochaeta hoffmannii TaxID=91930 RepID=A0AA38R067_9PEZI|nr:Alpha/beta-hydrolase [Coniochaeta hoffmannii]